MTAKPTAASELAARLDVRLMGVHSNRNRDQFWADLELADGSLRIVDLPEASAWEQAERILRRRYPTATMY